ncbi:MAG TPA: DUF4843 domain-containing protein [Niabella sp.]|nr:DUF4843 domain-containing protein [Niabella sp.]
MKFKNILLIITPCFIALGCKKQDILIYDSEIAGVYFQEALPGSSATLAVGSFRYLDSLYFSFASVYNTTKDTVLSAPVLTMGKLRDYARPFKVSADPVMSTAVEGTHYEIDYSSAVIPAGAAKGYVRVKFKRTGDMLNKQIRLVLKLEENEHFKVYMQKQDRYNTYVPTGSNTKVNADRWTFIVDDILTQPPSWVLFRQYWGTQPWTRKKYTFINSVLGWTHQDWTVRWAAGLPPIDHSRMPAAASLVRDSLQTLANAGTPMLDEDGSKMQLASSFLVRY